MREREKEGGRDRRREKKRGEERDMTKGSDNKCSGREFTPS